MITRILTLVGSLRANSFNRGFAEAAIKHAPEGISVEIYEGLAELPFYNEDLDGAATVPPAAAALREAVRSCDALLMVTPEYNGTVPGVLKNAIDWVSRPHRGAAIDEKPVAVIGTSAGRYGGTWAHDDGRKIAGIAGARVLDNVSLSVPHAAARFANTHPTDDEEIAAAIAGVLDSLSDAVRQARMRAVTCPL